jgi:hypothetical protein
MRLGLDHDPRKDRMLDDEVTIYWTKHPVARNQ